PASDAQSLDNFRQLQIALIKNQKVLTAVLRDPKLSQVQTFKEVGDPMQWMEDSLSFAAPGNAQVLDIKLQGMHPEDLRLLLNAIMKNYLTEFINSEQVIRNARLEALRRLKNDYEAELRKADTARNQFLNKGAGNANMAALQMAFLRSDLERLKGKIG